MSTKSNRSSGTQHTQRGVNQGVVLVDPKTGLPVDVVFEGGQYKLATTGSGGGGGPSADVNIISSVPLTLRDPVTGDLFKVNPDGSINANVQLDAADGDNVMIVGTEDGTFPGAQRPAKIDSDGDLHVKDEDANSKLQSIENKLDTLQTELEQKTEPSNAQNIRDLNDSQDSVSVPGVATEAKQDIGNTSLSSIDSKFSTLGQKPMSGSVPVVLPSDQSPIPVELQDEPIKISGTEDGSPTGPEFTFINNSRLQILAAHDRDQEITYDDFGTKNQRVTRIDYTSPTFPGIIARKEITYTQVGNRYRRDNITWSII